MQPPRMAARNINRVSQPVEYHKLIIGLKRLSALSMEAVRTFIGCNVKQAAGSGSFREDFLLD